MFQYEFGRNILKTCLKYPKFEIKIEKWSIFGLYVTLKVDGSQHEKKVSFLFLKFCFNDFFDPLKIVIET